MIPFQLQATQTFTKALPEILYTLGKYFISYQFCLHSRKSSLVTEVYNQITK